MKVAILSDIHGNSDALRACLAAATAKGAERLLILGDFIGYYYDPRGVLQALGPWKFDAIAGNHERMLAWVMKEPSAAEQVRLKYGSGLDQAVADLQPADVNWLVSLPPRLTVQLAGLRLELCHGTPADHDAYLYPDAPSERVESCRVNGVDFVLLGHTHRAVAWPASCTILNPGSVGQPRDEGGAAAWCLLDCASGTVTFERTAYDTGPLMAEARRRDPGLPFLADVLARKQGGGPSSA